MFKEFEFNLQVDRVMSGLPLNLLYMKKFLADCHIYNREDRNSVTLEQVKLTRKHIDELIFSGINHGQLKYTGEWSSSGEMYYTGEICGVGYIEPSLMVVEIDEIINWANKVGIPLPDRLLEKYVKKLEGTSNGGNEECPIVPLIDDNEDLVSGSSSEDLPDEDVEVQAVSTIAAPSESANDSEPTSDNGTDVVTSNNQNSKDQDAVDRGTKKGHKIRAFKKEIKKFVEDEKNKRSCTCNHLMLAEYIKKKWSTLMPQLYGPKDPKTEYNLNKEPIEYIVEACCEAFKDNNWPRVRNKDEGRMMCEGVPQHTKK